MGTMVRLHQALVDSCWHALDRYGKTYYASFVSGGRISTRKGSHRGTSPLDACGNAGEQIMFPPEEADWQDPDVDLAYARAEDLEVEREGGGGLGV